MKILIITLLSISTIVLNAWDDHPDSVNSTDRAFNNAQDQTGAINQGNDIYQSDPDTRDSASNGKMCDDKWWFGIPDRDN